MTTIVQAATDDEIADARRLTRAFASWRREGHAVNKGTAVENEEQQPENGPAISRGRLLIAYEGDRPAGCASLRGFGDGVCEVEQIFVTALFRGQRIGRALVERLILEAKAAGCQRMRFGISLRNIEALRLCERAGFHRLDVDQPTSRNIADQDVLFEQDLRLAG